jgi:hypothetical protein
MSDGTVRQWRTMFNDERINVHDEERSGQSSVLSDDLVQSVDQKICERQNFLVNFHKLRALLSMRLSQLG